MALPPQFMKKKPGNAAEDAVDGGMDDAQETPLPKKGGLKPNPKKKAPAGLPPGLQNAIARKLGNSGP